MPHPPWTVPVPVRPAEFTPLHARDADVAVETDLGAIGAFGVPRALDPEALLHADHQLAEHPTPRLLGSGRAGVYRSRYLKGVGRTSLAANWADPRDPDHASGHLFASSAARELLVSAYLDARGATSTIVPCTGVLVRPLPRELALDLAAVAAQRGRALVPADAHLQAITVKPAGFARWSNLLWFAAHTGATPRELAELGRGLARHAGAAADDGALTPDSIAAALATAVERAAAAFEVYFRVGVAWGSYANNFTLDGRFLDLEVPVVVCEPLVYQLHFADRGAVRVGLVAGTEIVELAAQTRAAVGRLRELLETKARVAGHPAAATFARALADALGRHFGCDHWIHDRDRLAARVAAVLAQAPGAPVDLHAVARAAIALRLDDGDAPALATARAGFAIARPEPLAPATVHVARGSRLDPAAADERAHFQRLLERVEAMTDPDAYLAALADAVAAIRRYTPADRNFKLRGKGVVGTVGGGW